VPDTHDLVLKLKKGVITARDLTSVEFEDVVALVLQDQLRARHNNKDIQFKRYPNRGPIDIVLKQEIDSLIIGKNIGLGPSSLIYYIECKNYGRNIEFDRAAKSFVVAIADQPSSLIIVSPRTLQPQAFEYARRLFRVQPEVDGARPLFGGVEFRVLALGELIGAPDVDRPYQPLRADGPVVEDWCLSATGAYGSRTLVSAASGDRKPRSVAINAGQVCSLTVLVSAAAGQPPKCVEVDGTGVPSPNVRRWRVPGGGHYVRFDFRVPPGQDRSFVLRGLIIHQGGSGKRAPFPNSLHVRLIGGHAILADVRESQAETWAHQLWSASGQDVGIVCVRGEAGIGKSYLCDQIVRILIDRHGFQGHRLIATVDGAPQLLLRLIWRLIGPRSDDTATDPGSGPDTDIGVSVVGTLLGQKTDEAVRAVLHAVETGQGAERASAALMEAIAVCLPRLDEPHVFVIQNAHAFSAQDIFLIDRFLRRLQEVDFHHIRLILESREEPGGGPTDWSTYVARDMTGLERHVRTFTLKPVDADAVERALIKTFVEEDAVPLVAALMTKCGGNPLFMEQILQDFRDKGAIDTGSHPFRVTDFPHVRGFLTAVPNDLGPYLQMRLMRVVARIDARSGEPGTTTAFLKIMAVLEQRPDPSLYLAASALSENALFDLQVDLQTAQIFGSGDTGGLSFAHELLAVAALDLEHESELTNRVVAKYIEAMRTAGLFENQNFKPVFAAGRLSELIGDVLGADGWLVEATKIAEASSNFLALRRALEHRLVIHRMRRGLAPEAELLSLEWKLAYVELQSGSQYKARQLFQRALDAGPGRALAPEAARLYRVRSLESLRHLMALDLRLGDPRSLFEHAARAVEVFDDPESLAYTLSRIVLAAVRMNCLAVARRGAALAWALLSLLEPTAPNKINRKASLLSDIGRIYLSSDLRVTRRFWSQACRLGPTQRERMHALTNLLIADAMLTPTPELISRLRNHARTLEDNGHDNPLIRCKNVLGIMEWRGGEVDTALRLWRSGLDLCQQAGHEFFQWMFYNNLGVAALALDTREEGYRYFRRALRQTEGFLVDPSGAQQTMDSLVSRAAARAQPLLTAAGNTATPLDLPEVGRGGDLWRLLWTLAAIRERDGVLADWPAVREEFGVQAEERVLAGAGLLQVPYGSRSLWLALQ